MVLKRCVYRVLTRALAAEQEGRTVDALRMAESVVDSFPLHPDARLLRARLWAQTGRLSAAQAELQDMVDRDGENSEARLALMATLMLQAHYREAIDHLQHVARVCVAAAEDAAELPSATHHDAPALPQRTARRITARDGFVRPRSHAVRRRIRGYAD